MEKDLEVKQLYEQYPFPSRVHYNNFEDTWDSFFRDIGITKEDLEGKTLLDAGCGTGESSCMYASFGAKVTAFDFSEESIRRAKINAQQFKLDIDFSVKDILDFSYDKKFDFIFCIGVLHHTKRPILGFYRLVKHLNPGGYIVIGVYNKIGGFPRTIKSNFIKLLAGKDTNKRVDLALKLFSKGRKETEDLRIRMADTYAHPLELKMSIQELFDWFKYYNIKYVGSKPYMLPHNKITRKFTEFVWLLKRREHFVMCGRKI